MQGVKLLLICTSLVLVVACNDSKPKPIPPPVEEEVVVTEPAKPNILLVIMDDVGIDQMEIMGYGGLVPPATPSIAAISKAGVRFRNTWSMPECSPGRAALLVGQYPLRTNMYQALGPNDLANSQLSPYTLTVPKLLQLAGYENAMFGKFHLGGPELNPFEYDTPTQLGWDYFYGWLGGLPASLDTTAGGIAAAGTYSCGFVPSLAQDPMHGANSGACYTPSSCEQLQGSIQGDSAGLQCLAKGGVLVPRATCQAELPAQINFDQQNAHYVSELVITSAAGVENVPLADARGRGFRSIIEAKAASEWIQNRAGDKPWMATLSFSSPHTPLQHPPAELLSAQRQHQLLPNCSLDPANILNARHLTDAMIEGLDQAFATLMIETGIAFENSEGELVYNPASNTLVIVVGDNGSFGPTVKLPFDTARAKGSAYQTGVWVPLIVAGDQVVAPDRNVEHMVNATDVYALLAEIAGVDPAIVTAATPDSVGLLAYLENENQSSLRDYNFTQGGLNIQKNDGRNGPCAFASQCSHTPTSKSVCEDNGGAWWGVGADDPVVVDTYQSGELLQCWQVNQAIYNADAATYAANKLDMGWSRYQAIRNNDHKLVRNHALDYVPATDSYEDIFSTELYAINQAATPQLDTADSDLLAGQGEAGVGQLSEALQAVYTDLQGALGAIMASQPNCPGDGNGDGKVDHRDVLNYQSIIASGWQGSSWYDVNFDGVTDAQDLAIIEAALGTVCGN